MQLQNGRGWLIYGLCALGFVLSMFYRVSMTVIAPSLTAELGLDASQLSAFSAAFFYAFAASQIPAGLILDRVGIRLPMTLLMLLAVAGALLFATAHGPGQMLAARLLMGAGMSCGLMGSFTLMAHWFPPRYFATLSTSFVALGSLGQMMAATPLALLDRALGWRGAFLAVAGVNLALALVFWLAVRDQPPGQTRPAPSFKALAGLGRVLTSPYYWAISLGCFFRYGCLMALQGLWAGLLIVYGLGRDAVVAGNALLGLSLGFMVALPLVGRLSDSWLASRKKVIVPAFFVFVALFLVLSAWHPDWPDWLLYLEFFLLGVCAAPGQIAFPHIKELMPPEVKATAMTSINLFTMLGPAAILQLAGLLVDGEPSALTGAEGFRAVWYLMGAGCLASGLVYLLVPDTVPGGEERRPA